VAFTRWDPVRDLLAIHQRLDRLETGPDGWVPAVDLHETPDAYILSAELPGLRRDDIEIHVREDHVTLEGVRHDHSGPCSDYHCVERGRGSFARMFQLPGPVHADQISANLHDGVLTVICPKAITATSTRVRVS
jgi:HSP20 family protein